MESLRIKSNSWETVESVLSENTESTVGMIGGR